MKNIVKLFAKEKFPENYVLLIFIPASSIRHDIVLLISSTYSSYSCEWWMVGWLNVLMCVHQVICSFLVLFALLLLSFCQNWTFSSHFAIEQIKAVVVPFWAFSIYHVRMETKGNKMQKANRSIECKIRIWRTAFESHCFVVGVRASHHPKIRTDNK